MSWLELLKEPLFNRACLPEVVNTLPAPQWELMDVNDIPCILGIYLFVCLFVCHTKQQPSGNRYIASALFVGHVDEVLQHVVLMVSLSRAGQSQSIECCVQE